MVIRYSNNFKMLGDQNLVHDEHFLVQCEQSVLNHFEVHDEHFLTHGEHFFNTHLTFIENTT